MPKPSFARTFFAGLLTLFCLVATASWAQSPPLVSWPPSPSVKLALNPATNKVYAIDEANNAVTVLDAAGTPLKTIPVGQRPQYIAVNPTTNRIYVNTVNDSSVSRTATISFRFAFISPRLSVMTDRSAFPIASARWSA